MRASHIVTETRSNDTFSFTANANTNIAYTSNGLNQGKQADATVYGFDANGNLTSDGWFTFTYDIENKLVSALPINAGVRTLNYDPLNRLDVYNPGTAKRLIYDGAEVVAELDSSGNIVGRYVRGDAPDEIITGYTSSNPTARGWYHLDNRNSVVAVTDPNGVVTVVNRYDEYGQPQGGNYGTFQYTGQMWLGEIGIYNYKNRMYWPNERPGGRFMQADPVGPVDSANLYQYALNDPVNLVDPLGLCVGGGGSASGSWDSGYVISCPLRGGEPTSTGGTGNVPGTNERGSGGGGGDRAIVITAKRTQRPTACQLSFLTEQLARRGLPTAQLKNLRFVAGLDSNAGFFTRIAFNGGAIAVTQGTTVYVQPDRFSQVANFRSAIPFEEAYHTSQFASEGGAGFYRTYGTLSLGGLLTFGRGYKGNLYESFAQGASQAMFAESRSFMCR